MSLRLPQSSPTALRKNLGIITLILLWWAPILPELWGMAFPSGPTSLLTPPGVGITVPGRTELAILALTALLLSSFRPNLRQPHQIALAAFLLQGALASFVGGDLWGSFFFMTGWLAAAAVYLAAPFLWGTYAQRIDKGPILHLSVMALTGLCLAQPLTDGSRAAGPFELPGALASWLILVLPLLFAALLQHDGSGWLLALFSSSCGLGTLILTGSRGAWFAGILEIALFLLVWAAPPARTVLAWLGSGTLALMGLLLVRHHLPALGLLAGVLLLTGLLLIGLTCQRHLPAWALLRLALSAMIAAVIVGGVLHLAPKLNPITQATERMASLNESNDASADGRLALWRGALNLAFAHPFAGVGPGRFGESYPQVQTAYSYYSDSSHSFFLDLSAETGLIGAALFLLSLALILKNAKLNPRHKPWQRAPLVGLLAAAAYTQIEVSYHYGALWITAAFLLALLTPAPPPLPAKRSWPKALIIIFFIAALAWVYPWQRTYQVATLQKAPAIAFTEFKAASNQLPSWGQAALATLAYGIKSSQPPTTLTPLATRALRSAPQDAVAYQMAGEVALSLGLYPQARQDFSHGLTLDRFNRPGIYHGLWKVAQHNKDTALKRQVVKDVLTTYKLGKEWDILHLGHRQTLLQELSPLLFDIADDLSPLQRPRMVEPIYRFLLANDPQARGYFGLAVSLLAQHRPQEAKGYLARAHALASWYPLRPQVAFVPANHEPPI